MRQLQETFPGHCAFTPSNSANRQRSSKYATSERAGLRRERTPLEVAVAADGADAHAALTKVGWNVSHREAFSLTTTDRRS